MVLYSNYKYYVEDTVAINHHWFIMIIL